ncbi:MAG: hypothetical protein K0Q87_1876 [Neobacillus sp.]|jgi:hypothetical protein|nr:hypothetical protein [Neobacillus sp.]
MDKERFIEIAENVKNGVASRVEIELYLSYLEQFNQKASSSTEIKRDDQTYNVIKSNLYNIIHSKDPHTFTLSVRTSISIAATILVLFFISLYQIKNIHRSADKHVGQGVVLAKSRHTSGSLTLANGSVIELGDIKNSTNNISGIKVSNLGNGSFKYDIENIEFEGENIIRTALGQQIQVQLVDGSKIWLNAGTSLKYDTKMYRQSSTRSVEINGEAYFEIAKNPQRPFIVKTGSQKITVLGTHFNVCAYNNELGERTTLLEGSVSISSGKDILFLKPGEQVSVDRQTIKKIKVNAESFVAWKDGMFSFNEDNLADIMKRISRWYDIDVIFQGADPNSHFGGTISRYENLEKVLERLELTGGVSFKVEGRKVYVRK